MNFKQIFVFLFLTANVLSVRLSLSNSGYSFRHFDINNGLSQNTVHCIFQDRQGFMWFGTKDGLNRFDGTSFKVFRFSPTENLRDNVFHRIVQDKQDNIWVGTEEGVYIYDPRLEKFERFDLKTSDEKSIYGIVSDMIQDYDGDIWISVEEKGVFHYDIVSEKLSHFSMPIRPDGMAMVSLCAGKEGDIWVFPYNLPVLRINKKTGNVSEFKLKDDPNLFNETGEIWKVQADEYNQLLIASSTKGFFSVNTVNKTHRPLVEKDSYGQPIFVRCFARIDPNTFWIGSESGLYIYDIPSGKVQNLRRDNAISTSLSDNAVYSIFKDREGGIWVGTFFGGVNYYSSENNSFELFYPLSGVNKMKGSRVREFCQDPDGKLWIGTEDNGLNLFDPQRGEFLPLPKPLQSIYTNIHALYADGDYLWVGTFSKGLNRYHLKTGKLTTYTHNDAPNSISHNSTFAICKDRQGKLWIGNLSGLDIYNYDTDDFTPIPHLQGMFIQDIFEDTDGKIWVCTFGKGLHRYDPATDTWKTFLYNAANLQKSPFNKLTSVFEDSRRRLWVTTEGGGFYLFDREKEDFVIYNTSNGLANNVVYQMVEDDAHKLWLSTNGGLVRFDPETGIFRTYTVDNGLRTNQFNYKSSFKADDGTIYFGSLEGFVRFNPSDFKEPAHIPSIVFTELYVNNKPAVPLGKDSPLTESICYAKKIRLNYRQNSFSIRYAVLDFSNTYPVKISYKLQGFNKEWIEANPSEPLIFSNLNPGKYKLAIRLDDNTDIESNSSFRTIDIEVLPPFWLSGWAYLIYFLLAVGCLFWLISYLRARQRRLQSEQMAVFRQQKERELYQSKIDFFTNVAHEIKTPLSLIKAPLDYVLMSEKVSDTVRDNLQIMSRNTDRLLNLTNQLLDFRKTESEAYLLNPETQNVSQLIRDTYLLFTSLATRRNIHFQLDLPRNEIFVRLDKEAFLKIVSNLVNNAMKYCDSYVKLSAFTTENDGKPEFHLVVENDGDLIPSHFKDEIFKPFIHIDKQTDKTTTGIGIGLALSRSLAELHNGTLVLEESDEVNRFHLTLPMSEAKADSQELLETHDAKTNGSKAAKEKTTESDYTVLLVEDDVELLGFVTKCLSPIYNILTAENGLQALEVLSENTVHLIVTDVMMPEMNGFEFTRKVKSDVNFSHIPVILLTAKTNVQSKVQGFETGADAYIEKPFSIEVLMAQVANLLQSREKLRETFLKHPFIGVSTVAITKSDEEFIQKLHGIVQANLGNSDFNVEDISDEFNMSRASFYRKIKGILDLTPNEYIRVERLKKAAQLLKENNFKVNEICYMVGFNSPSYFSKCFQQQFGVLPKDFI